MSRRQQEVEELQEKLQLLKEQVAEREGQLRLVKMNLETSLKQQELHGTELARYEETVAQLRSELDRVGLIIIFFLGILIVIQSLIGIPNL